MLLGANYSFFAFYPFFIFPKKIVEGAVKATLNFFSKPFYQSYGELNYQLFLSDTVDEAIYLGKSNPFSC